MALTLIDQFRSFTRAAIAEQFSTSERCVYITLLWYYNELGRPRKFALTDTQLGDMAGVNRRTVTDTKNSLRQKGWLDYESSKKRVPTIYTLTSPICEINAHATTISPPNNHQITTISPPNSRHSTTHLNREEKSKEENNNNPDLLTNSRELTPAEEQVKSAFESTFHPLTKMGELDMLKAYTGDYGAKAVLRAIEAASKSKRETWDRHRLSPTYLLPILQTADEQRQKPATQEQPVNPLWIPRKKTPEELEGEKKRLAWLKEQELKYGI